MSPIWGVSGESFFARNDFEKIGSIDPRVCDSEFIEDITGSFKKKFPK